MRLWAESPFSSARISQSCHLRNNNQIGIDLCHRATAEILGKAALIRVLVGGTVALGINIGIANVGIQAQGAESMRE
jgi:hypothetical protein